MTKSSGMFEEYACIIASGHWSEEPGRHDVSITADQGDVERYFELLKELKVKGYLFQQQNYIDDAFKKQ